MLFLSCKNQTNEPPPPQSAKATYKLWADRIGASSARIHVAITCADTPYSMFVNRDHFFDIIRPDTFRNRKIDTVYYDEQLTPKQQHTYRAYLYLHDAVVDSSAPLVITTQDSASHQFQWTKYILGDQMDFGFDEVSIVNDTCIWAVGEVSKHNAALNTDSVFNVAHWDGMQWSLFQVKDLNPTEIPGLCAFSHNDVWIANAVIFHWDGSSWTKLPGLQAFPTWSKRHIWGTSSHDLYFAGTDGHLAWYDGSELHEIETGTNLPFRDLWGAKNEQTQQWEIIGLAGSDITLERKVVRIENHAVGGTYSDSGIVRDGSSTLWFDPGKNYFLASSYLYYNVAPQEGMHWRREMIASMQYNFPKLKVRGNSYIDYVVVGWHGNLLHYNGVSWRSYGDQTGVTAGFYRSVAMKGNLVVAVGESHDLGIITVGKR